MERLRGALLAAFVLGLGTSITLSDAALAALTALFLWRLRRPEARAEAIWPLAGPLLAFSALSVVSALASPEPRAGLLALRGLAAALYVTADALRDGSAAGRFLTGLSLAAALGAAIGLIQVGLCPGSAPTGWSPAWIYHRCDRARGFFSIYMTLGGVLLLVLVATLPRLLPRAPRLADPEEAGARERVYMWRSGVAMWSEHRWLGVGPGGVKREFTRFALPEAYKQRTRHVYNAPLQILVERGLLGFAAWLWIWVAFFHRAGVILRGLDAARLAARGLVVGCLAAVAGFLVAGLTEYNFGDAEVVLVLWAVMALPFVVGRGDDGERGATAGRRTPGPSPNEP